MSKITSVIIGTGSYNTIKSGNKLSISRDHGKDAGYIGNYYDLIAPTIELLREYHKRKEAIDKFKPSDYQKYLKEKDELETYYIERYYQECLQAINPHNLLDSLCQQYGEGIILLCYEEQHEFCHRRVFADYLDLKCGIHIPELVISKEGEIEKVVPKSYQQKLKRLMGK